MAFSELLSSGSYSSAMPLGASSVAAVVGTTSCSNSSLT